MIELGKTLVSDELLNEEFVCNLSACKGECCVAGDAGAPLSVEEMKLIEKDLESIKTYLPKSGVKALEEQGAGTEDPFNDDELVTPLVNGRECAYTIFEKDGTALCGIEKAWQEGKSELRKPVSCHLYPVRIKEYRDFSAVNYDRWDICSPACLLGQELKVPVYKFLKDALIRKFGEVWYEELEKVASGKM